MKKLLCIICMIGAMMTVSGCKISSYKRMNQLNYSVILSQKHAEYYVFVYSTTCTVCESIEDQITTYAEYAKSNQDALPIFIINLNSGANKGIVKNSDEIKNFLNTKDYKDIHFSTAPGLIRVKGGAVAQVIAKETTDKPKTEILELIDKAMGKK